MLVSGILQLYWHHTYTECDSTATSESHIHQQGGGGFSSSSHAVIYPSGQASQASSKCNAAAPINLTFSLYRQIN